jgi:putative membrane protein
LDVKTLFSPQDLAAVEAAVRDAEARTSGEIVPYAVSRCDSYDGASWKAATFAALVTAVVAAALHRGLDLWGVPLALWIVAPPLVGAALGYLACELVPAVKLALVPAEVLAERVAEQASIAFLEQEVFNTRDRTGILIFLSLLEHRVVILGDSGINEKVEQHEWDGIASAVAAGIGRREPGAALVEGIAACGDLLERHGVARREDDRDELDNRLRRGDA